MDNWFSPPMSGELSLDEISKMAEEGKFHEWNFEPFESQENGYEDVLDEIKKYRAVDYLALDNQRKKAVEAGETAKAEEIEGKMNKMVDDVLKIYREKEILPIQYFSDFGIMDEIEKCISYKAKFDGNTVSCVDRYTEYFNGTEWKQICNYTDGEKVLQYNVDGTAELVDPVRYIHQRNDDIFYYIHDEESEYLSMVLTGNHSVVYRDGNGKLCKATVEELLNSSKQFVKVPCSYRMKDSEYSVHAEDNIIADIVLCLRTGKEDLNGYVSTESGRVCLTDKVFRLDLDSRSRLCTVLGLSGPYTGISAMDNDSNYTSMPDLMLMSVVNSVGNGLCKQDFAVHEDVRYLCCISDDCARVSWKSSVSPIFVDGNSVVDPDKYCFEVPSHMLVLRRGGIPFVTGNCGAGIGTTLCNYLFPNIFDTPSAHDLEKTNARSLYEKFHNDEYLKRAIKFCYSYKDGCPVPTNVMGGLRLVGSAPTNFRPMNAKAVYERFCPDGGVIYDFCCVSGDTEFFCGDGWKPISEYMKGDKVLQYNEDGTAEMVKPEEYIHYRNNEPFYEYENEELASCLTGNHDVVYESYDGIHKIKQSEILDGFDGCIPITCEFGSKERVYSDKDMIIMATHFVSMSKDDLFLYKKFCRDLYGMSYYDKCRFLESIFKGTDTWFTLNKNAADIVTTLCRMVGYYSVMGNDRVTEDIYYVERDVNGYKSTSKYLVNEKYSFKKVEQKDKYCFVVPSHMLVLRYKGKMFITGNCGFGGRMLGALSSKKNFRYVGTDPCTETMYHLHQLGDYIEMVTGKEDSYELHCCGSEDFRGPENSIDFAFSSPPYFNLEVYSDEETQCYNKFPELEQWLEGYVRQTIKNIYHMLKPGALYAVNIADFKVGSGREVAYVDEWKRISAEEGMPLFDTVYLGVTSRAGSAEQAAGELKKENIMIFKKPLR